jgi:hypothetical protein
MYRLALRLVFDRLPQPSYFPVEPFLGIPVLKRMWWRHVSLIDDADVAKHGGILAHAAIHLPFVLMGPAKQGAEGALPA